MLPLATLGIIVMTGPGCQGQLDEQHAELTQQLQEASCTLDAAKQQHASELEKLQEEQAWLRQKLAGSEQALQVSSASCGWHTCLLQTYICEFGLLLQLLRTAAAGPQLLWQAQRQPALYSAALQLTVSCS